VEGVHPAAPAAQHTKFDIDLNQLGHFLAEAFIKRIDAFVPADRITILTACRARLAAENGDILEHLLIGPQLHLQTTAMAESASSPPRL
jgi:hypothetical protein